MTEIHLSEQDRAFIDEQLKAGVYKDLNEVIHASLCLLNCEESKKATLQRLIRKGLDDANAGHVHRYAPEDDFLSDIRQLSAQQKMGRDH